MKLVQANEEKLIPGRFLMKDKSVNGILVKKLDRDANEYENDGQQAEVADQNNPSHNPSRKQNRNGWM